MSRLATQLTPLVILVLLFALAGVAIGFFLDSFVFGAVLGAVVGVLIFFGKFNASRAIKDSPEGKDAGYIRGHGGGSGDGGA